MTISVSSSSRTAWLGPTRGTASPWSPERTTWRPCFATPSYSGGCGRHRGSEGEGHHLEHGGEYDVEVSSAARGGMAQGRGPRCGHRPATGGEVPSHRPCVRRP